MQILIDVFSQALFICFSALQSDVVTLHLDTYDIYYTLLGAFYNFRMKYPLKCATFVDLGWPLRIATVE